MTPAPVLRPRSIDPRRPRSPWLQTLRCAALAALGLAPAAAADRSFADLSIEELMDEPVTSVSKREIRLGDSPAAITVLTRDDILRSGHRSLPELLRLVPGLDVARIHAHEWALSARGFTSQYANKLLVLVDGRSVYSPMFAGVYWNAHDVLLDHIDRVEVIRGPGASLWGANAVNGVINVTTRTARETQGGTVTTSVGSDERTASSVSYGGRLGANAFYRVFAKYTDHAGFAAPAGRDAVDSWTMARAGGRLDWEPTGDDLLTLQGEYYRGGLGEHFDGVSLAPPFAAPVDLIHHNFGGNVVGRWTRQFSATSDLSVQAYYDRFHQWDGDIAETRDTVDFDFSHRFAAASRHDLTWGLNYRFTSDRLTPTFYLSFAPDREKAQLFSGFVQDEITLVPRRLKLTAGTKIERHEHVGLQVQPSIRALWTPTRRQTLWASVSRAVRTPSRFDFNSRINAAAFQTPANDTFLVALFGHRYAQPEKLLAYELGYRTELNPRVSADVATFFNVYDRILAYVPGAPTFAAEPAPHYVLPTRLHNVNAGDTYGSEFALQWRVTEAWKLAASHTFLRMHFRQDRTLEAESPRHQFQLRSFLDLSRTLQLNAALYHVGAVQSPFNNDRAAIDGYQRLDLSLTWRPRRDFELTLAGQNLLDPRHPEFGSFKTTTLTEVPRSLFVRLAWRF